MKELQMKKFRLIEFIAGRGWRKSIQPIQLLLPVIIQSERRVVYVALTVEKERMTVVETGKLLL